MTPEQLRKIDALVAEHVMGLNVTEYKGHTMYRFDYGGMHLGYAAIPCYTVSIQMAWEVVETFSVAGLTLSKERGEWYCGLGYHVPATGYSRAPTAPLAICLAALEAKGVDIEQFI